MKDLFGKALLDYFTNTMRTKLILHNKFSDPDELELDGYFFTPDEFPDFDLIALSFCEGKILDIGAAAGRHTLYLQEQNFNVTALDLSGHCVQLMELRGVKKIMRRDIFEVKGQKFDTLFMLMNGLGMAGNLEGFTNFLLHAKSLLNPGGILICDSADVSYLSDSYLLPKKNYPGEIDYCYEYDGKLGDWFSWLYLDEPTLTQISKKCGWKAQVVFRDTDGQYLAILNQ